MQLMTISAGQQHSFRVSALEVQSLCVSWQLPQRRWFSNWGWVLAISFCLLHASKHYPAQCLSAKEIRLAKEDSFTIIDLRSSYNSYWPDRKYF